MEDFSHAVSWKGPLEEGASRFTLLLDHDDGGPGSQGLLLYLAAQALRQGKLERMRVSSTWIDAKILPLSSSYGTQVLKYTFWLQELLTHITSPFYVNW